MKIKESKNLKYTKLPFEYFEIRENAEPEKCILENFHGHNERIELNFRNGTVAFIEALNSQGGLETDRIETKLASFIGRSYQDILNADF